jgi:hypothetical protein
MSTDAGFLNDLGLDNVEADPNYISDGDHPGFVFDSKVVTKKDNTKSWVLTFKVAPEDTDYAGKTQDEWYSLSVLKDGALAAPSAQQKSYLKKRVLSLGVPESKVATFDPAEVIGTAVFFGIRHRNGYQNVGEVRLRDEATGQAVAQAAPAQAAPVSDLL